MIVKLKKCRIISTISTLCLVAGLLYYYCTASHDINFNSWLVALRKVPVFEVYNHSVMLTVIKPKSLANKTFDVTLVTHSSSNNLYMLHDLFIRWNGPIHVSVFVSCENLESLFNFLLSLLKNFQQAAYFLYVSLIMPLGDYNLCVDSIDFHFKFSKAKGIQEKNYDLKFSYPSNLLRYVGSLPVQSDFILQLDIDFLPSFDLRREFLHFYSSFCNNSSGWLYKTAFVLPAYETNGSGKVIYTKKHILNGVEKDFVRPFYIKLCSACQEPTQYDQWESLSMDNNLKVAYTVPWQSSWEPFFIAHKQFLPQYDGRFMQFGYNRISQLCEMHLKGYVFSVLNKGFVIHQGFKEQFHSSYAEENQRNELLYKELERDLRQKYNTSRHCIEQ